MARKIEISRQRIYRKYANFPKAYKIIHPETDTECVMRGDSSSLTLEDSLEKIEKNVGTIEDRFDEKGVLKMENGGSSVGNLKQLITEIIKESPKVDINGVAGEDYITIGGSGPDSGKAITIQEFAQYLSTIMTTKPFVCDAKAPDDKAVFWIDSANSYLMKFYNGKEWMPVNAGNADYAILEI